MSDAPPPPRLRPLNDPRPVRVTSDARGFPLVVRTGARARRIEAIRDTWRIDDEWWRTPISRRYHDVVVEGGRRMALYQDLLSGRWYAQG